MANLGKNLAFLFFIFVSFSVSAQPGTFVQVKGHQFVIDNKPFYYIGANYWYGGLLALEQDQAHGKERLLKELDFLKTNGINNLRVLVGAEGLGRINGVDRVKPPLQATPGVYDDTVLNSLDFFLSEIGKRKMYAVLYLSNNWEWSGGFLQYVNWQHLIADDTLKRKLTWDEQRDYTSKFYSCTLCIEGYRKQLDHILDHVSSITGNPYTEEPAIMAWELANEPRPMRPDVIPEYRAWISATAEHIKSKDKNHLVTIGSEGMMGTEEKIELFEEIHQVKAVDYLTIHIWPKNWNWFNAKDVSGGLENSKIKTSEYIKLHENIAAALNKPLVIEEFGYPRDAHAFNPASTTAARDQYYQAVFSAWKSSKQQNGVIAGCNFWAFGGTARPVKDQLFWKDGDDFSGDPPQEEQGLNSVFDSDSTTWKLIRKFLQN